MSLKLIIRITEADKAKLAKDSKKRGCESISEYIRTLAGLAEAKAGRPAKKAAKHG